MTYTVSEVAKATGITVRTLHHYDEIGVLHPARRSRSGYRMYDDADLERLQEILFFRALGFGLNDVRRSLADPDRRETLLRQRALMVDQAARFHQMVDAIDRALEAIDEGTTMSKDDMFEVFGDFDPAEHAEEARERWGETDAYRESQRRTKSYGKGQWKEASAEGKAIAEELAALMADGDAATSATAMDLAERHRQHISRWFYSCPYEMHVGLGEMYTTDARFTAYWDKFRPGLAIFVRDAFRANAERVR